MKKTLLILLVYSITLISTSCLRENHSIRLTNKYYENVLNMSAGTANIGNVSSGATSEYTSINTGNFDLTGATASGKSITGSGTITGKGTHKWTLTLSSAGQISIAMDK